MQIADATGNPVCDFFPFAGKGGGAGTRPEKLLTSLCSGRTKMPPKLTTNWCRASAIADYPGFNSYLEISGERMRFVIDAKIERADEVPKLQEFIACMADILALPSRRSTIEVDGDWAE